MWKEDDLECLATKSSPHFSIRFGIVLGMDTGLPTKLRGEEVYREEEGGGQDQECSGRRMFRVVHIGSIT